VNTGIVIGVTGGIAAYKIPHLVRLLRKEGAQTKVVLTPHAHPLVGIEALRTVSGNRVYCDEVSIHDMDHIRLTEWGEILLIAPATANTIAKIAHGIADNLLTTLALSFSPDKTFIAPAMNTAMWENRATQDNIALLLSRGYRILPVGNGELACGTEGAGRLAEIETIVDAIIHHAAVDLPLSGKRILISSGPTEEPIDPVRVITNRSSGRMGAAIAGEALRMGADVTVVSGPAAVPLPDGVRVIAIRTAQELESAMQKEFGSADICIMAAAVSDYRPALASSTKIHRVEHESITMTLIPTPDILAGLGLSKRHQFLVGFALENSDDEVRVREKMARKKCDLMVLNRIDNALGTDTTTITMLDAKGGQSICGPTEKRVAAHQLLLRIIGLTGISHE